MSTCCDVLTLLCLKLIIIHDPLCLGHLDHDQSSKATALLSAFRDTVANLWALHDQVSPTILSSILKALTLQNKVEKDVAKLEIQH